MPIFSSSLRMVAVSVTVISLALVTACKPSPAPENIVEEPNGLIPEIPAETTMGRAALLTAVAAAASDYAAGIDDLQSQMALDGKRFEFRIPFGCTADASILDHTLKLAVRPDGKAYEVSAHLDIGTADVTSFFSPTLARSNATTPKDEAPGQQADNTAAPPSPVIEAAEGFWVGRPWMLSSQCPVAAEGSTSVPADEPKGAAAASEHSDETAPAPPPHLVGIVQYYGANDSRVGFRNGKPLTKIEAINPLKAAPADGAIILLQGRLRHWPNGKVIQCRGDAQTAPPQCLVSTTIDRMAFQRTDNSAVIAEWTR